MKKHSKNQKPLLIILVLAAALIAVSGWYFLSSQKTILRAVTEKDSYFFVDTVAVKIELVNPKNADAGEVTITYPNELVNITNIENSAGVSMRELDNNIIFTLSDEFFKSKTRVISELTVEHLQRDIVEITFDTTKSSLTGPKGPVDIHEFKSLEYSAGIPPSRDTTKGLETTNKI